MGVGILWLGDGLHCGGVTAVHACIIMAKLNKKVSLTYQILLCTPLLMCRVRCMS